MTFDESTASTLPEQLALWQETLQWCPTPAQVQGFQAVYEGILRGNQQMNLTRITEPGEFWEKHLWDSMSGLFPWLPTIADRPLWAQVEPGMRAIDIGTGAGFPGLPAAIAFPTWHVTLLDSTRKKIRFLEELAESLGLGAVKAVGDRAEFAGHQPAHREVYDLALIRAVGPAPVCAELALPLLKIGGIAVLYRGQWTTADADQIDSVAALLGGKLVGMQPWTTPLTQGVRHCVYLQKMAETDDDYPRPVGIPAKHPLGQEPTSP